MPKRVVVDDLPKPKPFKTGVGKPEQEPTWSPLNLGPINSQKVPEPLHPPEENQRPIGFTLPKIEPPKPAEPAKFPPKFIENLPANTKVHEGEQIKLACRVDGYPKPTVLIKNQLRKF